MSGRSRSVISGNINHLLRAEGFALFAAVSALYARMGAPWTLFFVLFLVPDLTFLFYLAGARVGAIAYNMMHSTIGPLVLVILSQSEIAKLDAPILLPVALIWLAHIGFDRALGFGLKYASGFGDTHLGTADKKHHQFA